MEGVGHQGSRYFRGRMTSPLDAHTPKAKVCVNVKCEGVNVMVKVLSAPKTN